MLYPPYPFDFGVWQVAFLRRELGLILFKKVKAKPKV
jgi:hypothetical protein